jgi:alpha-galactosidase
MNNGHPKIAFVGAGSVEFTRMLLGDILSYPELREIALSLHDIDAERLETAEGVARITAEEAGASPRIEAHLDRRRALDGADYVVNMIQVGGHAATLIDHEIPARYGLRQTIGDTLGVGGVFRALRTIPVMQGIAADMAAVCPEAWLLNYTNPMAMLCWATYAGTPQKRVVGLCHSVQNTTEQLAGYVGVPIDEVTFVGAGVNHQAFILRFERDGESLYPLLDRAIEEDPELLRRVRVQMYLRLGYFPTESSEHSAEYLPWLMRDDEAIERLRIYVGDYVDRSEQNLSEYDETRRLLEAGEPLPIEPSNEYAPQIIHSIETGRPRVVYGNVENTGLIENLPRGACVEVPCLVDSSGVHPVHIGELPPQCAALNRTFLNVCELTVRAALEGRPDRVRQAVMLDPNAAASLSLDQIWELCDELTAAHGEALPEPLRTRLAVPGAAAPTR